MKIYFTAAISNVSPELKKNYQLIVNSLEKMGHTVIASHALLNASHNIQGQTEEEAIATQKKLSKWKKQSDVVLVEGTTPSFGVGQEISEALSDNKQVVILYMAGNKPHILMNQNQEAIYFAEYNSDNLTQILEDYIEYAKANSDTRFNFFISPQIGDYLDWVSQHKRIPRAVYLRRLIVEDMKTNKEFNEGEDA